MLLEELLVKVSRPVKVYCDNKAVISHNPVHHDRFKHIEVDSHFFEKKVDEGIRCFNKGSV